MPELIKKLKSVCYKDTKGVTVIRLNLQTRKPNNIKNKINIWDLNNYLFNLDDNNDIKRINILLEKMAKYKEKNYIEEYN